jgi:hypothetical protein
MSEGSADLKVSASQGAPMDLDDLMLEEELDRLKQSNVGYSGDNISKIIKDAQSAVDNMELPQPFDISGGPTRENFEELMRMSNHPSGDEAFGALTERLSSMTNKMRDDLTKMKEENRELAKSLTLNPLNAPEHQKGRIDMNLERSKFVQSLENYQKLFENINDSSLLDANFDPASAGEEYRTQAADLVKAAYAQMGTSKKILQETIQGAQHHLDSKGLLGAWENPGLYKERFKEVSEAESKRIMEEFSEGDSFENITEKVKEMARALPLKSQKLVQQVKDWEEKFKNDPVGKEMEEKLNTMEKQMKELDQHFRLEAENAEKLTQQVQSDAETAEKKFKEEMGSQAREFQQKLEDEYQQVKLKMEMEMDEHRKNWEDPKQMESLLQPLYEKKVDDLENRVKGLEAECNFLRTLVEEQRKQGSGTPSSSNPSSKPSLAVSPMMMKSYEDLMKRVKSLERKNTLQEQSASLSKKEEIDIEIEQHMKLSKHLRDMANIRIDTPFGEGYLIDRRKEDGIHIVELQSWELANGARPMLYIMHVNVIPH